VEDLFEGAGFGVEEGAGLCVACCFERSVFVVMVEWGKGRNGKWVWKGWG
jgi:hypothetical protein